MTASAGCWDTYAEVCLDASQWPATEAVRWHHVDAYAVQHAGGAERDRRQRRSVAVHLTSLCLLVEHGQPANEASTRRTRTSETVLRRTGLHDWPYLEPPSGCSPVTIAEVHAAREVPTEAVRSWADIVRQARR